ncbi:sterol desaturase family protein [Mucilaginibacter sp. P25]|uniref:Sterol desaturase/sphingolipid hydroxylase, fatty acid hydroxylase superfamily n=1 Tax=Mucilaginibacter gossypii TaxID=551996 RepID=A0A1G8LQ52_9SPHI|nr:sterol desaturase family protein [Mucilaginibacter gossypii]SDI57786.1 Sterol desaturase/sphingolipid hydroxylase, fatty acid hydroxylase superfamily [Mucilaginibacter gossypii]
MPLQPSIDKITEISRVLLSIAGRYLVFAGALYLFFYVWRRRTYWYSKIQQRYPESKHILREIVYSFFTILIFGAVILLVIYASKQHLTGIYPNISDKGYPYYFLSIGLMILMHDTYFYWTHRVMHWKPLFKLMHKTHHLSTNPTPFAAYAFHPLEAVVEIGIVPLIAFTIPYHGTALTIFSLYSLLLNVTGHLGYELFPQGFTTHKLFKWHNTSTHHNMHHRLIKCNYGLYFNIWDRLMGTNHPDYEKSFEQVVEKREKVKCKGDPGLLSDELATE